MKCYRSIGKNTEELYDNLKKNNILKSSLVESVVKKIDRAVFYSNDGFLVDAPSSIGYNATISAPHMHIFALQLLEPKISSAKKILDVGSGSGYLTLCLALMSDFKAKVIGIDHIHQLVEQSKTNIINAGYGHLLEQGIIEIVESDGRDGLVSQQPYDLIHVGAASEGMPKKLIQQLNTNGRMVVPVEFGDFDQKFLQIDKEPNNTDKNSNNDNLKVTHICDVSYIPLTDKELQLTKHY